MQAQGCELVCFSPDLIGDKLQGAWDLVYIQAAKQENIKPMPDLRVFIVEVQFCLENQNDFSAIGMDVRKKAYAAFLALSPQIPACASRPNYIPPYPWSPHASQVLISEFLELL